MGGVKQSFKGRLTLYQNWEGKVDQENPSKTSGVVHRQRGWRMKTLYTPLMERGERGKIE